jgi:glycosyltransferase involved in cell wall biosynthesis
MRVVQLGPYPPPHGGVGAHLASIHGFLSRRQIPCAVINLSRYRRPDAGGVYYPSNALQLLSILLRLRYEVIHLHIGGNLSPRLLALGLVCCLMPGAKSVLTFHSGGYPSSPEGRATRARSLRGLVFRRFDRLIGVNEEIVKLFHRLGCSADRTSLISPHAFSIAETSDADATALGGTLPQPLRQFWESHAPVLLTVGLLEPEYDLPLQLEVLGPIRESYPGAGLAIIGAGSLEKELRVRIRDTPYAEHILLCGDVAHASTLRAISESNVLLRTTRYDGDSIAVREALHLGTQVVATENGMRPPGVRLVPAACPAALREAIEEVLAAPPARRPARTGPDERNLEAVLAVYRELTA